MKTTQQGIFFSDLKKFSFYRYLFKAIWLFFPAVIFLFLSYACFWKLTQGKDLMVITVENRDVFLYFILAQVFWAYVTWYSSRLVAKAKELEQPNEDRVWVTLRVHGPRLLAFTSFSIVILAFLQLPHFDSKLVTLPNAWCQFFLLLSFPAYFISYKLWDKFCSRPAIATVKIKQLIRVQAITWFALVAAAVGVIIFKLFIGLLVLLIVMQQALVLLLIIRRRIIETRHESFHQQTSSARGFDKGSQVTKKTRGLLFDKEDKDYFKFFFGISLGVIIVYFLTVFSIPFAANIGSFPFVLIAFGVLLLLGNIIAFVSVLRHFNFHVVFMMIAFIMGLIFEPHAVKLNKKKDISARFDNRQDIKTYFRNWINEPERKKILDDPSVSRYPVFFGLANGGASRSGYWVASVLGKLEDTTKGNFSNHLFCLSGASGGSVGNAVFFSLLRGKERLKEFDKSDTANYKAATDFLGSDFLTYTIARMLGPDVFRHILPLNFIDDRAAALSHALETSPGKEKFLYDSLGIGFSEIITQRTDTSYNLPVLFINATRMQDGSPAVFSTIDISNPGFDGRVDVLDLLDEEQDIKLSSAVVLGASFPYISPAGRLNTKVTTIKKKDGKEYTRTEPQYFVDGGYFDNSGAGVVNEMIALLQDELIADTTLKKYAAKLQFYILHISNDPIGFGLLPKVNPIVNDLAAPLKTLMGGYGSQTAVNDKRLKNFMRRLYGDDKHYIDINLYRKQETNHYSMNWVISDYLLSAMRQRLLNNENINDVLKLLE